VAKVQQWVVGAAVAAVALLAAGWFLLVAPERAEAVQLREQTALQEANNAQLETALAVLRGKAATLVDQQAELDQLSRRIPDSPALPDLLRALSSTAASAGVELLSVTPAAPAAPEPAAPAAVPAPADPAAAAVVAAPVAPAPTTGGVSAIEVQLVVVGDFHAVEHFLALLEELPRALRVTGLSLDPGVNALADDEADAARAAEDGRSVRAALTARVFTSAGAAAITAPAPAAPSASTAAQDTTAAQPPVPAS
jgi:Tfp pilus assembly protein PilO